MISCTSPPEQKLSPAPGHHHRVHVGGVLQLAEQVAQLRIRLEGERVLAFGRFSVTVATPSFTCHRKCRAR
jgi:hypothetical protein